MSDLFENHIVGFPRRRLICLFIGFYSTDVKVDTHIPIEFDHLLAYFCLGTLCIIIHDINI